MKNKKEVSRDYTALKEIGKKTLANMKGIRHMFTTKKPYIKTTEGYIVIVSGLLTISWLVSHNFPRIFYILGLQYFVWKAVFQYFRENSISMKYRHITKMFDGKVKVIAVKDNEYVLNSFIPLSVIESKKEYLENYFNKNILSITQSKKNLRHITIKLSDLKSVQNKKVKLESIYPLPDYIQTAKIKGKILAYIKGIDSETGKVIVGDLTKVKSLLVAGVPGAGKSVLESVILQSLMYYNKNLFHIMVDFKDGVELCWYEDFDNTYCVETLKDFSELLDVLEIEMKSRYRLIKKKCQDIIEYNEMVGKNNQIPYILLTIDEVSEIRLNLSKEEAKLIEDKLVSLMNKARAAGIYFMICTQRPDREQFDPRIKSLAQEIDSGRITNQVSQGIVGVKGTENFETGFFKTNTDNIFLSMFVKMRKEQRVYDLLRKIHEKGAEHHVKLSKND